jgi:acyl transferase domain-containing protein/esterase/lipase
MSDQTEKLLGALRNAAKEIERLRSEKQSLVDSLREPIAIIGLGCRFPGGVTSPESFWKLLDEGIDAITEVPRARWDVDAWYDPDPDALGKMTTRWGGFVPDLDHFEPAFFGISPREAASIDPQERLLLETSWEALERAGQTPERLMGSDTAVYMGLCGTEYQALTMADARTIDAYALLGTVHSAIVGRLSYWLGFKGPNLAVDTACSSSLVAVHLACQALRHGECSMALAAGANVVLSPEATVYFSRLRAMSPTGRCHAFAAQADGYVRSEGCGVVVLKRLSDAQRDGDAVLALIRGSAINQDGRSQGMTAPNGPSQQAVIRRALDQAGVLPAEVGYVECHGTGTPLGDPIEVQALGAALAVGRAADRPVMIGSVKSNFGHTEGAAGVAGLIKAVLVLDHGRIPKNLHFSAPNPYIPWAELPVKVAAEAVDWPRSGAPRRAGVSSFGFSGTNAHVVLEEAPAAEAKPAAPERSAELVVLSAKSAPALQARAGQLSAHLSAHPLQGLCDIAFSLATTRSPMEHRLAVSATSREALREALDAAAHGQAAPGVVRGTASSRGKVAFLFTGQGAQVLGMGRALCAAWPAFREAFERCVAVFDRELSRSLREVMWAEPESAEAALLDQTGYTQPALFAVEYALCALWRSWGVQPEVVAGHSIGELVAACVAEVFSLEDAVRLVAARGRLMQELPAGGAMVSIAATEAEVAAAVASHAASVSIAAVNGPEQVVIAGAEGPVQAIAAGFAARGVRTKPLRVSHAFHSPLMAPMLEEFRHVAESVTYHRPSMALISNLTGRPVTDEVSGPGYWVRHVREAVRFADGVKALREAGANTFIEVGPKSTLLGLVSACLPDAEPALVASLRAGRDEAASALEALGGFWASGGVVDWTSLFPAGGRRVPLPTYPWQRERYWVDSNGVSGRSARRADLPAPANTAGRWPLAGVRVRMPGSVLHHSLWVGPLRQPFLADHTVFGKVVVAGAFHVSVILAVAAERWPARALELTDVEFLRGIVLEPGQEVELHAVLTPDANGDGYDFELATCAEPEAEGGWTTHARGRVRPTDGAPGAVPQPDALEHRATQAVDGAAVFERVSAFEVEWGPLWQWLRAGRSGAGCSVYTIVPTYSNAYEEGPLHPCLLDNGFGASLLSGSVGDSKDSTPRLPFAIERLRWWQAPRGSVQCAGISRPHEVDVADLVLVDEDGGVVAEVEGLTLRRAPREVFLRQESTASSAALFRLDWSDMPLTVAPRTGREEGWVVVAAPGSQMAAALRTRLDRCIVIEPAGLGVALVQANPLAGVICLWEARPGEEVPEVAQRVALEGLSVVRTLRECAPARLWWVTMGAVSVEPDDAAAVATAPIWGLGRTVMQELPELDCTLVDLAPGAEALDQLVRELAASDGENQVAWRAGRRHVARLARAASIAPTSWAPPTQGTVLLTGGLGALGLHVARWLAQLGVPHLVLTGRRGVRAPGAAEAVAELEALGTRVTVAAVDVADREVLRAVIEAIPVELPLRGVIHAAGVLADGVLTEQDAERFARVLSPKVTGAWNLHELTAGRDLVFFVMFSSLSGLLGAAGQGNYAAANAFLDALAAHRRASGLAGQSLAWGPWSEVGMAAGLDAARRARLAGQGFAALSAAQGLALLGQALARPEALLGAVSLDLGALGRSLGAKVPPVWRALVRVPGKRRTAAEAQGTWASRLAALPEGTRMDEVRAAVRTDIARVLSVSDVPGDQPLLELGLDSLMGLEVRNALGKRVGMTLPATMAFDHPTLNAITRWLLADILTVTKPEAPPDKAPAKAPADESLAAHGGGGHSSLSAFEETRVLADGRAARYALRRAQGGRRGPALLLLHGATHNHHHLSTLADLLGKHDLLVPSLPGRCGSDGPPPVSAREAAQWVRDLLAALDVPQVVAVGHSHGGIVALELALMQAALPAEERPVRGLILVATAQRLTDPKVMDIARDILTGQGEAGSTDTGLSFFRAIIARSVSEERLHDAARVLRLTPINTRMSDSAAAHDVAYMDGLEGIDLPTVVIAGSADPVAPLSHARDWAKRIPESRLVVLEGVGHHPPLEAAEEVAEEVLSFMHNFVDFSTKFAPPGGPSDEAGPPKP